MGQLDGKVTIVTGATRGIGRAIALAYAEEGAAVVAASRTATAVADVVAEIEARGAPALGVTVDVGERAEVEAMVQSAVDRFGRLDVLVNNAQAFGSKTAPSGSVGNIALEDFPEDVWDYTVDTGLKGTLYGMQAAFPHLRERGGKIINFGSSNGLVGVRGSAAYNACKEAIRGLSRTAAAEWGRYGICVNVLVPNVETDSARSFFESRPGARDKIVRAIPMQRMGTDDDIGPIAVFLASDNSNFITGQSINVDGGQVLRP
jgi:NAD(P)-dependent dehydrogenase (short-subunit alcohol dehydrogenase family)